MTVWPYPRWIAHRGAGLLAPENTLAALRAGADRGWRMFECDVKLSSDGVAYLLHDDTLDRTTNGRGPAATRRWADLSALDAGGWCAPAFAGEPLPSLAAVLQWATAHQACLNLEIKPSPGTAGVTGQAVARAVLGQRSRGDTPPLLTSFAIETLEGARDQAPELPRGLLLHRLFPGWLRTASDLGCVAVVAHHPLWTATLAAQVHAAGLRCLAYTVNEPAQAHRLWHLGLDGLITDRIDAFDPAG